MTEFWNWSYQTSIETTAKKESAWAHWTDVPNWPSWDHELEWSLLIGTFQEGGYGRLKPKGIGPTLKFQFTKVVPKQEFTNVALAPFGTKIEFQHRIEPISEEKSCLTLKVEAKRFLAPLLRFTLLRSLKREMPKALQRLEEQCLGF